MKMITSTSTTKSEQTRQHILAEALQIATSKSLNDVTIGELAKASGLSKSGVYAHFISKENLQVAIIDYASELFQRKVISGLSSQLTPIELLTALTNRWLNWYEGHAKKCLFITATIEFNDRLGTIRDALHHQLNRWIDFLESIANIAITDGTFRVGSTSQQFVFELYSLYLGSQKYYWLNRESSERLLFERGFDKLIEQYTL
ncbi:TetR/AcrR family transcriptional regulator [Shewanella sp. SG41-4]|uniref:TetR/AcrR family transcriptional regulator n=1 Tax=Shewanella sp. SG41-4 TaxID=2760976 RepID=UPI0016022602|nr:TetR/AcrR family transcriptional regulator [Shewanella sp. SG41-4]MBB1440046.1 TetR/AcrR family transcriptional regulator [Shewanella sp. SG41-4]